MRNLTLGVLIIAGGTLAALPFRRDPSIQDASVVPEEATGPTQSALGGTHLEMLVEAPPLPRDQALALAPPPPWQPAVEPGPKVRMPLTYEELAVPLDETNLHSKKFSASVSAQVRRAQQRAGAMESSPLMESFALNTPATSNSPDQIVESNAKQPQFGTSFQKKAESELASQSIERKQQTATFASTGAPIDADDIPQRLLGRSVDQLPKPTGDRPKHWIRQP